MTYAQQVADARRRAAARKRDIARDIAAAKPFHVPHCARCGVRLMDGKGNPRWDVVHDVRFVCLGGCRPQAAKRKAAVS